MERPRVMVLGAGLFQVPGIQKAAASGCHVISVDYLPQNVGHRYSDFYENCSTTDAEAVLAAARRQKIDAITTFASDAATPTVALVAQELGLVGPEMHATLTMVDKGRFRAFQHEHGLRSPWFYSARSFDELWEETKRISGPRIFKPVDSSGSRGVSIVRSPTREACQDAFQGAQGFSRSGSVCVEELLEGMESGGDAFIQDGSIAHVAITRKHVKGCVVTGHRLPGDYSAEDERAVLNAVREHCRLLGYTDGPMNFDILLTPDSAVILEMSPRTGGNGIPWLVERHTGVDFEEWCLRWALGDGYEPSPLPPERRKGCGSWIWGATVVAQ